MGSAKALKLDQWVRGQFRDINTEIELAYQKLDDPMTVAEIGTPLKQQLVREGHELIAQLLAEGNTDEGFESGFNLLGDVGFFMAACRRHELEQVTSPEIVNEFNAAMKTASALSLQLGASLGVVPRFASAHLETHNRARDGKYKTFTHLQDETLFLDFNTKAVFAYIRASEALLHTLPLGISHTVTYDLLRSAKQALEDVVGYNQVLFEELDTNGFFYHVRPYYKTHRVGLREYRGANAGDFAGINIIDLLLGLCRADDEYYSQLLVDKFLFMRPEDQLKLRDCMRQQSLMDEFLISLKDGQAEQAWYQRNLRLFIEVCAVHGETALQHHNLLISKFIEAPAAEANLSAREDLTASGPPLHVMLRGLKKLSDLRSAAAVDGLNTRYQDLQNLRESLQP